MATLSLDLAARSGFRGWAARHPVGAFLTLLFGVAYPLMALPILADHGVIPGGSLPGKVGLDAERASALLLIVTVMLPSALWVTWAADGREGVRTLLARTFHWRFGFVWWLAVMAALPAMTIGLSLLLGDSLRSVDPLRLIVGEVLGLLAGFLLVNLWEEMAWAGVMQTRLERRHSLLVSALLTAVPFALIHMPLQFIGDFSVASLAVGLVGLLILGVVFRLMLGVVLRGTRDSVLAVALLHVVFNRSNNTEGIAASLLEGEARQLAALIATIALAVGVAIASRHRLGRAYRLVLDGASAELATQWPSFRQKVLLSGVSAVGLVGLGLYVAAPHAPRTPEQVGSVAELESFFDDLVASGNPPSLSVAVVKDGAVVYERAFGMADGPRGIEAMPDTVYHWWSMTKIPTAIAILQLEERGRLQLDAPVIEYLAWFNVEYPSPESEQVTVSHLLNHSSGLPDTMPGMLGWVHYDDATRDQTALAREQLDGRNRLRFEPGSDAQYSNLNYMLLGAVIEAVSGETYEQYVLEHVLRPLGMHRTDFVYSPSLASSAATGTLPVAHLYTPLLPFLLDSGDLVRERDGRLFWFERVYLDATPPSGLIGTAPDVARLMLAYLEGGALDGTRVSEESVSRMTSDGHVAGRGLGWALGRDGMRTYLHHAGGGPGFATLMRLYPDERLGIVLLANGTDLDRDGIADLLASLEW